MTGLTCMKCRVSPPEVGFSEEEQWSGDPPVCKSRRKCPSPGRSEPTRTWHKYNKLKKVVIAYLSDLHEADAPAWIDIWRALVPIMGSYQRDAFITAFDLDESAEKPCIRPLSNLHDGETR